MLDFSLQPYEWQKSMDIILQNVDLCNIEFLSDCSVLFSFSNCYDGNPFKKILCHNVWQFSKESNTEGEGFPLFICDIRVAQLKSLEIEEAFRYFRFGLGIPSSHSYTLLCLDSGEISIRLICENINLCDISIDLPSALKT